VQLEINAPIPYMLPPKRAVEMGSPKRRGSALLATLCLAGVLSLSVSGYLAVCYRSLVVSNREINASHSIELAEIGMDEALWALNNSFDATWVSLDATTKIKTMTDPAVPYHPPYPDPGSVPFSYDNGATGYVVVQVKDYATSKPVITAAGSVTLADRTRITRTLQAPALRAQVFKNAIGATGILTFNSGGLVDGYDSSDILHPNYDPANPLFSAVVSGANVDLGTATVYGFAATNGTVLQGSPAVTGIFHGSGIDPARVSTSATLPLFDVISQSGTPSFDPVAPHSSQLTNSEILGDGGYQYDSINLSDGATLTINGIVVLKITNSVHTSGSGQIVINSGGSLLMQIDEHDGQGLYLSGAGIDNRTGSASRLSIVVGSGYAGTNPPTSVLDLAPVDYHTNFFGTIYLPSDAITIASDTVIFGALVGKNITFTGAAPAVHYDGALRKTDVTNILGFSPPFALDKLREVANLP
jgi:hypothetical protein